MIERAPHQVLEAEPEAPSEAAPTREEEHPLLDLQRRAGNTAAEQAMEQAAQVGQGWAFLRIQQTLARSRVDKVPHWESLARLTAELDLPVLDDIAAIMRQSCDDGASVYTTLRSRARSLRSQLLADQAAEANADSEKMTAPGALLAVLVMLLIAFPAVIRILTT